MSPSVCVYIYIYFFFLCVCVCVYIYILHIHRKKIEREEKLFHFIDFWFHAPQITTVNCNMYLAKHFLRGFFFLVHKQTCSMLFMCVYVYVYVYVYIDICVCMYLFTELCLTICSPMDYSPPGSFVHGVLQGRILEWVVVPFSKGLFLDQKSNLCLLHWQADSLPLSHQGSPHIVI